MTKKYTLLTMVERTFIQLGLKVELKPAQMALELSRSTYTITRELNRNVWVPSVKIRSQGRPFFAGVIQGSGCSRSGAHSLCQAQSRTTFAAWKRTLGESH